MSAPDLHAPNLHDESDINEIAAHISCWADCVFPTRDVDSAAKKAVEEVGELFVSSTDEERLGEVADILILMLDLCLLMGVHPSEVIASKMDVNYSRKWEQVNGVMRHTTKDEEYDTISGLQKDIADGKITKEQALNFLEKQL